MSKCARPRDGALVGSSTSSASCSSYPATRSPLIGPRSATQAGARPSRWRHEIEPFHHGLPRRRHRVPMPTTSGRYPMRYCPPSTTMAWPVMNEASSLVKKRTAPVISRGSARRLIAC